jgi:glucosamine-6-phosphate deaminase
MQILLHEERKSLSRAAAAQAAAAIQRSIKEHGKARIIAATGVAQFEFLEALTATPGIEWSRVEMFHLDEYIGLPMTHPASFCRFLQDRLIAKTGITKFHLMDGERDPGEMIRQTSEAIRSAPIDVAFVGIGENGHLAFNDPPADFVTEEPYIAVDLDEMCRRQQVKEGWFPSLEEVPRRAISMSVKQVLKAKEILAIVPGPRKAAAIQACFEGAVSPSAPASILRTHPNAAIYLDKESASLLKSETLRALAHSA